MSRALNDINEAEALDQLSRAGTPLGDSTTPYMAVVIAAGVLCFGYACLNLPISHFDIPFAVIVVCTLGFGSRVMVQIPRFKSRISVSDTFIFLTLLRYGGEAAVVLAALDAFVSARRFCNRSFTVWFNAAIMAVATTAVVATLKSFGYYSVSRLEGPPADWADFLIALCLMAHIQFLVNTIIASVYDSMYSRLPWWDTWKRKYIWVFMTYVFGAAGAGFLVKLSEAFGVAVLLAAFPTMLFVLLAYKMYLSTVEMSIEQAERARRYASELEEQKNALRESEARFRNAFDYAPIGMALVSHEGRWLRVNHAMFDILGYSEDEFLASNFQSMIAPEDLVVTLANIDSLVNGRVPNCQLEQRYRHSSGPTVWVSLSISSGGKLGTESENLIFQMQEISQRKLAEQELKHAATHDVLTGLANRAFFMGRLSAALANMRNDFEHKASVLFIDLDHFKYVNDSHGHIVGDHLLVEISNRLRGCIRPADLVARLGGDEFTVLVEGHQDEQEITVIAERIRESLSEPFSILGNILHSSASIGILHASPSHADAHSIMRDADTAMYMAKRAGKGRHEVFDESMLYVSREQ
jgi:diguanylate cyclase (GGDEF)-like protein/PAS domain S-box-containing protein